MAKGTSFHFVTHSGHWENEYLKKIQKEKIKP